MLQSETDLHVTHESDLTVSTNLYCKPTDSHNYLLYLSEHPRHLLRIDNSGRSVIRGIGPISKTI